MAKHYNPFKMWGSWVGLGYGIVSIIHFLISNFSMSVSIGCRSPAPWWMLPTFIYNKIFINYPMCSLNGTSSILALIVIPISTFLIGFGIHSLIRKVRN